MSEGLWIENWIWMKLQGYGFNVEGSKAQNNI